MSDAAIQRKHRAAPTTTRTGLPRRPLRRPPRNDNEEKRKAWIDGVVATAPVSYSVHTLFGSPVPQLTLSLRGWAQPRRGNPAEAWAALATIHLDCRAPRARNDKRERRALSKSGD
ncbi:MAG: hypothetical protein O3A82_06110 [Verrucomicrobia bacterium]|nr:hypothetical protein [Verrucomicrobiota bacterium]